MISVSFVLVSQESSIQAAQCKQRKKVLHWNAFEMYVFPLVVRMPEEFRMFYQSISYKANYYYRVYHIQLQSVSEQSKTTEQSIWAGSYLGRWLRFISFHVYELII